MRKILATAVIVAGSMLATSAFANNTATNHDLGGQLKMGKMCWMSTSANDNGGYWNVCPKPMKAKAMKKKMSKK
jgi:hypothetical protein